MSSIDFAIVWGSQQRIRMLLTAVVACGLGCAAVLWVWPQDFGAQQVVSDEVNGLQDRLQIARNKPRLQAVRSQTDEWPMPAAGDAMAVWSWLEQRLQVHGLQMLSLKPQAMTMVKGLPEQSLMLRVQGRWRDWLGFEASLAQHAPWWTIDQWQVAPSGREADEVRLELQVRWGWRPPALPEPSEGPWSGPIRTALPDTPVQAGAALFASQSGSARPDRGNASPAADSDLPADPNHWPVADLRLLGLWHQADTAHAVLGLGMHGVVVMTGQRIGREGYRVRLVDSATVELESPAATQPVLRLTLQGDKR